MTDSDPRPPAHLPPTIGVGAGKGPSTPNELIGTVLAGRYRIVRLLGEGAMGSVYLGEHLKIGRQDAIKVLRDTLAGDVEAVARFIRGTRNVSMIRHPNICTIYDYSDTDYGLQFVAMEYVAGETLRDLILREGVLPLPRAVAIARQVAAALQAAHDAGIVHRDLKPANIMITPGRRGDEIKVVDFDIAKGPRDGQEEEVTRMGFVVGTPEYMSPEQLIGEKLDGRSDVYSLALVLFRMLTGSLPFRGADPQDVIVSRLTQEPMRLAEALPGMTFPEGLEEAIRRALHRKAEERQTDAEEFGEQIGRALVEDAGSARRALTGLPPTAVHSTRSERDALPAERVMVEGTNAEVARDPGTRRVPVVMGGLGLLAAAVLAAVLLRGTAGDARERLERQPPTIAVSPIDPVAPASSPTDGSADGSGTVPSRDGAPVDPRLMPTAPPSPPPSRPANQPIPETAFNVAESGTLLVRLLERLGPPEPGAPVLRAIRDSARIVADHPESNSTQQARAAYIIASALLPLGDTLQAVDLLERAVLLEPGNRGYNTLLTAIPAAYRGRGR